MSEQLYRVCGDCGPGRCDWNPPCPKCNGGRLIPVDPPAELAAMRQERDLARESLQKIHRRVQQAESEAEKKLRPLHDTIARHNFSRRFAEECLTKYGLSWFFNRSEVERQFAMKLIEERDVAVAERDLWKANRNDQVDLKRILDASVEKLVAERDSLKKLCDQFGLLPNPSNPFVGED